MFQRIARRHEDRSDEPVASETAADQPASADEPTTATPEPTTADDATTVAAAPAEQPAPASSDEQPTERIDAVPAASVPPPKIDLRSRIAAPAATAPAQPSEPPTAVTAAPVPAPVAAQAPAPTEDATEAAPRRPGFRARGRMRRRLRYLRKLRELQVRDLGGLVFDLRRFERSRDDLLLQKLDQIRACDDELRALEQALDERRDLRDVREPGIGGICPRCFAIHGSADRFCASCGAALGGAVQSPARPAQVPATPPAGSGSQQ